jgi:hypothetical protein
MSEDQQQAQQKDLLSRLADVGEDALGKLVELPGGQRAVETFNQLKNRVDELQSRLRSLDPLERRVTELEKRLDELESTKPAAARSTKKTEAET